MGGYNENDPRNVPVGVSLRRTKYQFRWCYLYSNVRPRFGIRRLLLSKNLRFQFTDSCFVANSLSDNSKQSFAALQNRKWHDGCRLHSNVYVPEDKLPKRKENETRQKQEFELPKHRLHKSDENFFFRATKLFNIISRTTEKPMTKKLLTEMYQNYFHRSYNELDSCTWRLLCNCGICNPMKKLVPNEN